MDYACKAVREFDVPVVSLDIANNGDACYLIEYQFVNFGQYTIQFARWHFEINDKGAWERVDGVDDVEVEFVRSFKSYILEKVESE